MRTLVFGNLWERLVLKGYRFAHSASAADRGRQFHRNTTCIYAPQNAPNIRTQNVSIDKPDRLALALCLVSKLWTLFKFQPKMLPMIRCTDVP